MGSRSTFLTFLGIGRILGSVAIVILRFPRLKEWAYAGFVIDLIAVSASHAYAGDSLVQIASPLILDINDYVVEEVVATFF
ncbi:MAG: DoxX family protein [Candidatus Pristimantibacillus sp.]